MSTGLSSRRNSPAWNLKSISTRAIKALSKVSKTSRITSTEVIRTGHFYIAIAKGVYKNMIFQ